MVSRYLASALLITALSTSMATAQTATTRTEAPAASATHREGEWRASKLVGVDVYNEANEKIGDISEIILDKSGKVANVIIGVGGFLGMGEHYVAVAYDKLKWVNDPVRSASTSSDRPNRVRRKCPHDNRDGDHFGAQQQLVSGSRGLQRHERPTQGDSGIQVLNEWPGRDGRANSFFSWSRHRLIKIPASRPTGLGAT
jgi:sporulation protein YlmC with PRC-barrel domain